MRVVMAATLIVLLAGCSATPVPSWTFAWDDAAWVAQVPETPSYPPHFGTPLDWPEGHAAANATWLSIRIELDGWAGSIRDDLHLTGPSQDDAAAHDVARRMLEPLLSAEALGEALANVVPIALGCTGDPCTSSHGGWFVDYPGNVSIPPDWLAEGAFAQREMVLSFKQLTFVGYATWQTKAGPEIDLRLPVHSAGFAQHAPIQASIEWDALGAVAFTVADPEVGREEAERIMREALVDWPALRAYETFRTEQH